MIAAVFYYVLGLCSWPLLAMLRARCRRRSKHNKMTRLQAEYTETLLPPPTTTPLISSPPVTPPSPQPQVRSSNESSSTPPPPLLVLLERVPDLFSKEVLARLTRTDRALFRRTSRECRAVVESSDLPRAGSLFNTLGMKRKPRGTGHAGRSTCLYECPFFNPEDFVATVALMTWALANGCPCKEIMPALEANEAARAEASRKAAAANDAASADEYVRVHRGEARCTVDFFS
jgi:hypothetical protein